MDGMKTDHLESDFYSQIFGSNELTGQVGDFTPKWHMHVSICLKIILSKALNEHAGLFSKRIRVF